MQSLEEVSLAQPLWQLASVVWLQACSIRMRLQGAAARAEAKAEPERKEQPLPSILYRSSPATPLLLLPQLPPLQPLPPLLPLPLLLPLPPLQPLLPLR